MGSDQEITGHLDAIERHVAAVRELLGDTQDGVERKGTTMGTYDHLDRSRRRRDEWLPRGIVFALISQRGELVDGWGYEEAVVAAGYKDVRAVNRFFKGEPEPVLERVGGDVRLTERGRSAVAFFHSWWMPRLRAGTATWPTPEAKRLLGGP